MNMTQKKREYYKNACLFLGHNASAVIWNNADDMFAIEDEKESRSKGGEYVPIHTILKLMRYDINELNIINFLGEIDYNHVIMALCGNDKMAFNKFIAKISLYELKVNHHSTHAINGIIEAWEHHKKNKEPKMYHILITDGTGDDYEATSLYTVTIDKSKTLENCIKTLKRVKRISAADLSCGILFARLVCNADTGFSPLKDEYKSLGYETEITSLLDKKKINQLNGIISKLSDRFLSNKKCGLMSAIRNDIKSFLPGVYDTNFSEKNVDHYERKKIKLQWSNFRYPITLLGIKKSPSEILSDKIAHQHFEHGFSVKYMQEIAAKHVRMPSWLLRHLNGLSKLEIRIISSYIANKFLETYLIKLINTEKVENLIVGGGVHFNVKLNNVLLNNIKGDICCSPLAGDIVHALTGAVILDKKLSKRSVDLLLLKRNLSLPYHGKYGKHVIHTDNEDDFIEKAAYYISKGYIVNTVKNWGELGPRALLSNSTLCLPTAELKQEINLLNGRDDHMPMAPVLRAENLSVLFNIKEINRVVGSLHGMIIALSYNDNISEEKYAGIMHRMHDGKITGRPLIAKSKVDVEMLQKIENKTGYIALINTSFNIHGYSTVQQMQHAYHDFDYQCRIAEKSGLRHPLLIIGNF
ncbi:carbamoyltransferase C-terminal domain-containing protein [Photorhabdus sp. RM323S]|uniref:carbamoyltransferase C-terminal domain-containing protein n=1 Tax=Photorhabdus sp. RM323S TaxID=3342828 RepID=UPI0036D78BED